MDENLPPPDSLPQIDRHICEHLFDDERNLHELVALYFLTVGDRLVEARTALAEANWRELTRLAHVVRGASGHIGAKRICATAAALEAIAPRGDAAAALPLLEELAGMFGKLRDEAHAAGRT